MCPWAARIGARRLLRLASGVLMDPFQPFERLHHLSQAAPAKVAAPRTPRAAKRLRSEGTDNAMRRTWSALRSIQVVVCLVLNVIGALVHPRHPPPPRGALHLPGHHALGKVVGKVALRGPPPPGGFLIPCFDIFVYSTKHAKSTGRRPNSHFDTSTSVPPQGRRGEKRGDQAGRGPGLRRALSRPTVREGSCAPHTYTHTYTVLVGRELPAPNTTYIHT